MNYARRLAVSRSSFQAIHFHNLKKTKKKKIPLSYARDPPPRVGVGAAAEAAPTPRVPSRPRRRPLVTRRGCFASSSSGRFHPAAPPPPPDDLTTGLPPAGPAALASSAVCFANYSATRFTISSSRSSSTPSEYGPLLPRRRLPEESGRALQAATSHPTNRLPPVPQLVLTSGSMACNLAEMNFVAPNKDTGKLLSPPQRIVGKVSGTKKIVISDTRARKTGSSKNTFFHYKGEVRCGDDDSFYEEATILAFDIQEKECIDYLHCRLSLVNHPYIMRSLGYESGSGEHQEYIFLAFPHFEETLAAYMEKRGDCTMQCGRFTEVFIELIWCVVLALLELHRLGFYCPRLNGRNIAVVKENTHLTARLWDFQALEKGNEDAKDKDWPRLGYMLKRTAENHESFSPEIDDLFQNIKNGTLKGLDILNQSALLKVRKKFENVLALNTFTLTHCKLASQLPNNVTKVNLATEQIYCNSSDKAKTAAFFENLLDCDVEWKKNTPPWLSKRILELGFKLPKEDTLREFVWEMRCLVEHENNYLITQLVTKISSWESQFNEDKDLESEIRKAWSLLFLYAQKFAASLALKY